MHVIFIVDTRGQCELAYADWQHMVGIERRVSELEAQASANELALRTLIDNPLNPVSAAAEARDILRILEG